MKKLLFLFALVFLFGCTTSIPEDSFCGEWSSNVIPYEYYRVKLNDCISNGCVMVSSYIIECILSPVKPFNCDTGMMGGNPYYRCVPFSDVHFEYYCQGEFEAYNMSLNRPKSFTAAEKELSRIYACCSRADVNQDGNITSDEYCLSHFPEFNYSCNLTIDCVSPSRDCVSDSDCVVYGESGDCNCGCYNKDFLPVGTGGECFCAAPTSCECINGTCEGVFE